MLQLRSICFLELTGMPAESTFPCQPEDMPRLLRSNTGNFADHSRFSDMHIRTLPNHSGGKRIFFPAKYTVTQQEKSKLLKVNIQKWELSEQIMKIPVVTISCTPFVRDWFSFGPITTLCQSKQVPLNVYKLEMLS